MSDLTHFATITHSTTATTGLHLGKAVQLFLDDVRIHSEQDVTVQTQCDGSVHVFCPADQDVDRAEDSARQMREYLNVHDIRFERDSTVPEHVSPRTITHPSPL